METALHINTNAAGSGACQQSVGVTYFWPYGGGTRPHHPLGLTFS